VAEDEPDHTGHAVKRRLSFRAPGLAMTTRIAATIVVLSVVAVLVATIVGIRTGRSINRELDREQPVSLQASATEPTSSEATTTSGSSPG